MTVDSLPAQLEQSQFPFSLLNATATFLNDVSSGVPFPHQKTNAVSMQIFSSIASLSTFTGGILVAFSGICESNLSHKLNDFWGKVRGGFCILTGGLQSLGGMAYMGGALSSLAYCVTHGKVALAASNVLQSLGGGLLSLSSLAGGLVVATELKFAIECKLKLRGEDDDAIYGALRQEVLDSEKGLLWRKTLSSELLRDIIENTKPIGEILEQARKDINKRIVIYSAIGFLSVAGFVLGVLSIVSTPIAPWMLAVAGIVLSVAWLALDSLELMESMEDGKVGQWEKMVLYGITLFSIATVVTGTAFAKDLAFMAASSVLGIILLLVQLAVIYKMKTE